MSELEAEDDAKWKTQGEDSIFTKMYKEIKIGLFTIVSTLLTQDHFRIELRILLIFIETLQILHYYFEQPLFTLWKQTDTTDIISKITSYTVITPILVELEWGAFKIFFWVFVAIAVIILLMVAIILYSQKKKVSGEEGLIKILKILTDLICSIGYLPFLETYLHVFYCQKVGDVWKHRSYEDVECYNGEQSSYTLVGGILAFILFFYTSIMTFINFESRYISSNCFTKTSGRGDVLFIFYKTICAVLLKFFVDIDYQVVLITIMVIVSVMLFGLFNFNIYYNNDTISKIITTMHSINMWAVLTLVMAYITREYDFSYSIYLFLLGIPIIFYIIITRIEQKYDILLLNTNNYKSITMCQNQLMYLTKLLSNYNKNPQVKTILNGFLDYHRTICIVEDCPSKTRVMKTTNFSKQLRTEGESETLITIIAVIQSLYYTGLQKFPNSTRLRILYSLYLCDIIRSKQQAIQELNNAQLEIPAFDEQFIIYRYQGIIENELISGGNGKGSQNESVNELSIQNYLNACRINIEKCSVLYMEFWSQLQDQTPDLGKLSDLGSKINILNQKVEEFYKKLIQLTHVMPAIMRYYAKFLMLILHDKEKSNSIMEKMMFQNTKGMNNLIDMENEHKPTLFMSAEDDSFCQVKNANLACQSILGYSKIELMNRNIKVAMPNLYAQYHNSFIYNYLNTLDPRVLGIERILPAKSKQDYIYAIQVYVRNVPSLIHGLQFSGQFYIEKLLSQTCFIIIDMTGKVCNISTQTIDIFDITSKKLEKTPYNIKDLCPTFYEDDENLTIREDLVSKHGIKIECQNLKIRKRPTKFQAMMKAENIIFRVIGQQGLLLRIEKIKEQLADEEEIKMVINDKNLSQHMGIIYDIEERTYKGKLEYGPPVNAQVYISGQDFSASRLGNTEMDKVKVGNTILNSKDQISADRTSNNDQQLNSDGALDGENQQPELIYGQKFRTIRLIGTKFIDVEDLKREEEQVIEDLVEEEEYNEANQGINFINGELEEESKGFYMQKVLMKKQVFLDFITRSKFLKVKSVHNLKIYSLFILFIMYLLSLLNYFVVLDVLNQSSDRYNLISNSYRQVADGQTILSKFLEIYAHKKFKTVENQTHIEEQRKEILFALNDLETIQKVIQLSDLELMDEHLKLFEENEVPMRFKINDSYEVMKFDLNEATQQIITKVNSLISKDISEFDPNINVDFDFLQYNLFNDYYINHVQSSDYYVQELGTWADEKQVIFIYLLVISIVFIVFGYIFIIPFYLFIMESQKEVLTLFLDIPQGKIKLLQKQCEDFAKSSQQGNDEEIGSEDKLVQDEKEDQEEQPQGRGKGKKRKKFRLTFKNSKVFFLPFLLCSIVFQAYFILSYSLSQDISNKFLVFIKEMHYTNQAESFFGFSNNALRQLLINSDYTIYNGVPVQEYTNSTILEMYNITSGIQSEYTSNIQDHQQLYLDAFQDVMVKDRDRTPCDILVERRNVSQANCEDFMDGSILQGFSIALARHFEHYRQVLAEFEYIQQNNPGTENNGDLFYSEKVVEMENMQKSYISNLFRFLIENFEESINSSYDNNNGTKVTLLIATLILLLMFYLVLWMPLISNINQEVTRIRSMITMIPLEICNNTPAIKNLLAGYITHNFEK